MKEEKPSRLDIVTKVAGTFAALVGTLTALVGTTVGLLQYKDASKDQKFAFINQRLTVLSHATSVATNLETIKIGTIPDGSPGAENDPVDKRTDKAVSEFWDFYNSSSLLLEPGDDFQDKLSKLVADLRALTDKRPATYDAVTSDARLFWTACEGQINKLQAAHIRD